MTWVAVLIDFLRTVTVDFFVPWTVLDEFQCGVILRLGRKRRRRPSELRWNHRVPLFDLWGLRWLKVSLFWRHPVRWWRANKVEDCVLGAGFLWHWPFYIDEVMATNKNFETSSVNDQQLLTTDDVPVDVQVVVGFEISDPVKFLIEVEDAQDVIIDATGGEVFEMIHTRPWSEVNGPKFTSEVKKHIKTRAEKYGVRVVTVYFHTLIPLGWKYGTLRLIQVQ